MNRILFPALAVILLAGTPDNGYVKRPPRDKKTSEPAMFRDPTPEPFRVPDFYLLPELDARHCYADERHSCEIACGVRGVKSCSVGTYDGRMSTLCECYAKVNLNLYVKAATKGRDAQ